MQSRQKPPYTLDTDLSERIYILRLIFMVMVVMIHAYAIPKLSFDLFEPTELTTVKRFFSFNVSGVANNGLFLLSSILLYAKEYTWCNMMRKKCRTLLLPYCIINTFWILFFLLMQSIPLVAPLFSAQDYQVNGIMGWLDAYLGVFVRTKPIYYPFWFLRDLFLLHILSRVLQRCIDALPICTAGALLLLNFSPLQLPVLSKSALLFFALGYYLVKYTVNLRKIDAIKWPLLIAVYLGVVIMGNLSVVGDVVELIFYYRVAGYLRKRFAHTMLRLSSYTFCIFAFHEYWQAMIKKAVMMVLPQTAVVQYLEYFLLPIVILVLCIFGGKLLKSIAPKAYRVITGGR